jgi:signal transduction histidine kinase
LTESPKKKRRLAREILGLLALSIGLSLLCGAVLSALALRLVDGYFEENLLTYTENQVITAQMWTLNGCIATALVIFVVLFLFLLGQKLSYIGSITRGVAALQSRRMDHQVPVEGSNELTELAEAINYLSARELELREKETALQRQREQLIRTLSHDIRTPLTSILSYAEYLTAHPDCAAEKRQDYLALMDGKARQIRQLTDVLLDGGNRHTEHFDDARLLLQQLADQMEAELEETFAFTADFTACPAFSGSFDVAELQRIFDNLTSNIRKYADPQQPVTLTVALQSGTLTLTQRNTIRADTPAEESHRIGLLSIRRIAQQYGGSAESVQEDGMFTVTVTFSKF